MLGNPLPFGYDIKTSMPSDFSEAELAECIGLITDGGAVRLKYARENLPHATMVTILCKDKRIVGVGAIKRIRSKYALDKATKSGVKFPPETPELGYVAVHLEHRGKKLSHHIVAALTSKHEGALFATTSSCSMKKTLERANFKQKGREWEGNSRNQLSLWLKEYDHTTNL